MDEFLVETYAPRDTASALARRVHDVSLAAEQVNEKEAEVRFKRAILLPEDETCLYLFESCSADAVCEAMTRAGQQPDQITRAVSVHTKLPASREEGATDDTRV